MTAVPRLGRLNVLPVPRLLVALRTSGYSGGLRLVGTAGEKRVALLAGNPVQVDSDTPGAALPKLLAAAGTLSAADAGSYDCVVTGTCGSATSAAAAAA